MKKATLLILFIVFFLTRSSIFAQGDESPKPLGLPGDNLDLYSVLNLFEQSGSLEEFERKLNEKDLKINNLDLNGDGKTDYINVVDNVNGAAHAIVLQVAVNKNETQDVAVIEVERDNNNQIHVQVIGDEALYGKNYIIEPNYSAAQGTSTGYTDDTYYASPMIASWPIVSFMYAPGYMGYASPYSWGYYPSYWNPWRPVGYSIYYGYHRPYYGYYHRAYSYHAPLAHTYYAPRRRVSATVTNKVQSGAYKTSTNVNQAPRVRSSNTTGTTQNNNASQARPISNNSGQQRVVNNTAPRGGQQRGTMGGNRGGGGGGRRR
jgi:hypothetical protein